MMESHTSVLPLRASRYAILGLRILTTIFSLMSLAILVTNVSPVDRNGNRVHFYDVVPYIYLVSAMIIGIAYSVFQTGVAVIRFKRENPGNILLNFYGDKVMSILLASGAIAGFVMTAQLEKEASKTGSERYYHKYFKRSHAANGLAFLGFICTFILSILSSYALPKKVETFSS